jgi:hypothetical protein
VLHRHGASFDTLPKNKTDELVKQSDLALLAKLQGYYGDLTGVESELLWESVIFDHMLTS